MDAVFLKLVSLSLRASILVGVIVLIRIIFRKTPKRFFCILWGFVALRLMLPVSVESALSLVPNPEPLISEIIYSQTSEEESSPLLPERYAPSDISSNETQASENTSRPLLLILPQIWLIGAVMMLAYALASSAVLRRRLMTATVYQKGIKQSEAVPSPFVFGIIRPIIYLPYHMDVADLPHVIAHELAHIRRGDHLWKPLGFLLLSVYWFNPVMWLAYVLLCRDIESACDEKVAEKLDRDAIRAYSAALVNCSVHHSSIVSCPLAFGENSIKQRIKNVMSYRKPTFIAVAASVVICAAVAVFLLTDPYSEKALRGKLGVSMDMAVAEHYHGARYEGDYIVTDCELIGIRKTGRETTVFAWVLCEEYSFGGGKLSVVSGSHIPTAVTFDIFGSSDASTYDMLEYWEPRDGSYYAPDIRSKFPLLLRRRAFDISCVDEQKDRAEKAAREYFGISDDEKVPLSYSSSEDRYPRIVYCRRELNIYPDLNMIYIPIPDELIDRYREYLENAVAERQDAATVVPLFTVELDSEHTYGVSENLFGHRFFGGYRADALVNELLQLIGEETGEENNIRLSDFRKSVSAELIKDGKTVWNSSSQEIINRLISLLESYQGSNNSNFDNYNMELRCTLENGRIITLFLSSDEPYIYIKPFRYYRLPHGSELGSDSWLEALGLENWPA